MEDKHKGAINKNGDDHDRKVKELNSAHGKTSSAKDKIIDDLTTRMKIQGDNDGE
jgi:hypothetical protein